MPTGYTARVRSGEVTELRDFALKCARAFLFQMRDEPSDAIIPDRFEPDNWHQERLTTARDRLVYLHSLTAEQIEFQTYCANTVALRDYNSTVARISNERTRYEDMLAKVLAWLCPDKCAALKQFMIEQLNESIRFDCYHVTQPEDLQANAWLKQEVEKAEYDITYHTKELATEVSRIEELNRWISALRSSLA